MGEVGTKRIAMRKKAIRLFGCRVNMPAANERKA
jgi:hypothetical protein